ncbi:MAG: hypothetical protein H6664_14100 [Ardenticatenaceae bacterium]|nr:hypothetical protein [Ardenticatenaceae bacterium]
MITGITGQNGSYLAETAQARQQMGWQPKVRFADLVRIMADADLERLGLDTPGAGQQVVTEQFGNWHCWIDQVVSM